MLLEAIGDLADKVEIESGDDPASRSEIDTPLWDALGRVTARLCEGSALVPWLMTGATDNRFFRRAGSVGYGFGLFSKRLAFEDYATMFHGNDERVDQESLKLSTELWLAIAEEFVGPQLPLTPPRPRARRPAGREGGAEGATRGPARAGTPRTPRPARRRSGSRPGLRLRQRGCRRRSLLLERPHVVAHLLVALDRASTRARHASDATPSSRRSSGRPVNVAKRSSSARVAGGFGGVAT